MKDKTLIIGSHVSMTSPDYFLGSVKEAISYNANALMFYTGAPQNSYRKELSECKIEEGKALLLKAGIEEKNLVCHAPYIVNLANKSDMDKWYGAVGIIEREVVRCEAFGSTILVLHPGAHMKFSVIEALKNIAEAIDIIYDRHPESKVRIALETMAGKGTEVGVTFEQIKTIIDLSKYSSKLGVCMDTCHINDFGYNVFDAEEVLNEFDRVIGLERLLVLHVNDSKNPLGAHKDRHENIGYGEIGFDALNTFVNNPRLINIPKILETPYVNEKPPYKKEIEMFRNKQFINNWRDDLN